MIYRAEILTVPDQGRHPDDVLADVLYAVGENTVFVAQDVFMHAGGMLSVRLDYAAPDDAAALDLARQARDAAGTADIGYVSVGRGRSYRRVALPLVDGPPTRHGKV